MFLADTHMHSAVSFDSETPRVKMALTAAKRGLSAICFTDHYDVVDEFGSFVPAFDWPAARREHRAAAEACLRVRLLYGLELGNAFADYAAAERAMEEPGLDCVIGSVHNSSRELCYTDYYNVKFCSPEQCAPYLEDYFQLELEQVRWGRFDVLGHLPYPLRYMRDRDGCAVSLGPYWDIIDEILRTIVDKGIALEVNTKGFRQSEGDYVPLLRRYRALGGRLVTVGADAHRPEEVGDGIRRAYRLLLQEGFPWVAVYAGRMPELMRIEDDETCAIL